MSKTQLLRVLTLVVLIIVVVLLIVLIKGKDKNYEDYSSDNDTFYDTLYGDKEFDLKKENDIEKYLSNNYDSYEFSYEWDDSYAGVHKKSYHACKNNEPLDVVFVISDSGIFIEEYYEDENEELD